MKTMDELYDRIFYTDEKEKLAQGKIEPTPCQILWHTTNHAAKIPSKREEDAGYDIYTIEEEVLLMPHEKHLFKTGLQAAINKEYWLMAFDRGSTGSKGLHVHCGVIDSGYRGEIFICLCNDNNYPVKITSAADKVELVDNFKCGHSVYQHGLIYPASKAIAQLIPIPAPSIFCRTVSDEEWEQSYAHNSERGEGKLGASGK